MHKAGTEMMIKMEKNMDLKNKYDSIIFDLDGTLWNSSKPICEAWNIILDRHKERAYNNRRTGTVYGTSYV